MREAHVQFEPSAKPLDLSGQRLEQLIRRLSPLVPVSAIAELLGLPRDRVELVQCSLGVRNSHSATTKLRHDFLTAAGPPIIVLLGDEEQMRLHKIWNEMRLRSGVVDRERNDELLRILNDTVPTCVLSRVLCLGPDAIRIRRRELGLKPGSEALHYAYLSSSNPAPHFSNLSPLEQAILRYQWIEVRQERQAERERRNRKLERKLLKRLRRERERLSGEPSVHCGNPRCEYLWPRHKNFFDVNSSAKDGLGKNCKVCEFHRRRSPKRESTRASPRIIRADERAHILEVLRENPDTIPGCFLCPLLGISRNDLMKFRRELGIKVTAAEANRLSTDWLLAETMPPVRQIFGSELDALEALWRFERNRYLHEQREEDEPQLQTQRKAREALRENGGEQGFVACYGPHCQGDESWPASSEFFRRYARCEAHERRCLACGDLEKRLRLSEKRKRKVAKTQVKDAG